MRIDTAMTVKITQIDEARDATVLRIEGKLAAGDAVMLTWILARLEGGERISIDMSGVTYLDGEVDGPRSYVASAWAVKGRAPD